MTLIKAIGEAFAEVIKWPGIVYRGLRDSIGISEWAVFFMAIGIISLLIFGIIKAINKWR